MNKSVLQDWVCDLSFMQQSVLLSAIRGCDGIPKLHKSKNLVKWYRRCIVLSAFDGKALTSPCEEGGGSYTGQISYCESCGDELALVHAVNDYVDSRDELPMHYQLHMLHAFEILGYKHPDADIRAFWNALYRRIVKAYQLNPETEEDMDFRLGDNEKQWKDMGDPSTCCSD